VLGVHEPEFYGRRGAMRGAVLAFTKTSGHAKRNEFSCDGKPALSNGGTQDIDSPNLTAPWPWAC